MHDAGFTVALIKVLQRMALADFFACAVFAVELVDVLNELEKIGDFLINISEAAVKKENE